MHSTSSFSAITTQVASHVISLFSQYKSPILLYHNITHTKYVVDHCIEIEKHYNLNEAEAFVLIIAAWFHDAGQLFAYGKNHEQKSIELMKAFFQLHTQITEEMVNKIEGCILATQIPHHPRNLLEEIICDADTYNLGTEEFLKTDKLLQQECELKDQKDIADWNKKTLLFLEHHKYFTSYCQAQLSEGKKRNMNVVKSRI